MEMNSSLCKYREDVFTTLRLTPSKLINNFRTKRKQVSWFSFSGLVEENEESVGKPVILEFSRL